MSAWKTRIQPRYARIRACSDSSPAALASASSRRSIVVCGSALSVEAQFEQNVGPLEALRNLGENLLEQQHRPGGVGGEAMELR